MPDRKLEATFRETRNSLAKKNKTKQTDFSPLYFNLKYFNILKYFNHLSFI
jgi:hypothetical protein